MRHGLRGVGGLLTLLLMLTGVWLVLAQPTSKPRSEEEDTKTPPPGKKAQGGKPRTEEEEDDPKRLPGKVVQDPDTKAPTQPRPRPAEPQAVDLTQAAQTAHLAVKDLFKNLEVPYDLVTFEGGYPTSDAHPAYPATDLLGRR